MQKVDKELIKKSLPKEVKARISESKKRKIESFMKGKKADTIHRSGDSAVIMNTRNNITLFQVNYGKEDLNEIMKGYMMIKAGQLA